MRKKRDGWDQRFGHVSGMLKTNIWSEDKPRVMLHAVSVGEVNALRSMVPELAKQAHVIVSTTTDTGLARAQSLFGSIDSCDVVRYPLDCSWMVHRFLDVVHPDVVGLVELEVWPNFIKLCTKRGIQVGIINGRLSARSFKGYRKLRWALRSTFGRLKFACVQDQDYGDRIIAMGVSEGKVRITGSMKWDSIDTSVHAIPSDRAREIAREMGVDLDRPIIVVGSTGPGEEALVDQACPKDVQVIIAPRKTDRFEEAAESVPGCVRRSTRELRAGATRFMLDTIGELSSIYEIADLVIIGRSFFDLYGSDPIEPAAHAKAIIIGPANSDFSQAIELLTKANAIQVVDRQELKSKVSALLDDPEARASMGARARSCVIAQQGASQIHMQVLVDHALGAH